MTSQPSETRTVRNIYGVLRTVRSHGTYNYRVVGCHGGRRQRDRRQLLRAH